MIICFINLITDLPDCSSPIINNLKVGVAKYQLMKPEIKVNIYFIVKIIKLNKYIEF